MFVSFMQVAIQETLDGRHGLAGWKWLFVFNAIMTVIIAAAGFFLVRKPFKLKLTADSRLTWPVQGLLDVTE